MSKLREFINAILFYDEKIEELKNAQKIRYLNDIFRTDIDRISSCNDHKIQQIKNRLIECRIALQIKSSAEIQALNRSELLSFTTECSNLFSSLSIFKNIKLVDFISFIKNDLAYYQSKALDRGPDLLGVYGELAFLLFCFNEKIEVQRNPEKSVENLTKHGQSKSPDFFLNKNEIRYTSIEIYTPIINECIFEDCYKVIDLFQNKKIIITEYEIFFIKLFRSLKNKKGQVGIGLKSTPIILCNMGFRLIQKIDPVLQDIVELVENSTGLHKGSQRVLVSLNQFGEFDQFLEELNKDFQNVLERDFDIIKPIIEKRLCNNPELAKLVIIFTDDFMGKSIICQNNLVRLEDIRHVLREFMDNTE